MVTVSKTQSIVAGSVFFILIFLCLNFSVAQPDLEVNGIFFEEQRESYAIVNGGVVKKGDTVGGAEVVEITKDFVKFQYGNQLFIKKVGEVIKKQQQNEIPKKKGLDDWAQSIIKRIRDIFGKEQSDNKVSDLPPKVVSEKKEQSGWGGYTGSKHYEKALSLKNTGRYEEAFREAQLSLKYDYVTPVMKKSLDSIIATCTQHIHNAYLIEQKHREIELKREAEIAASKERAAEAARKEALEKEMEAVRRGSAERRAKMKENERALRQIVEQQANAQEKAEANAAYEAEINKIKNQPDNSVTYTEVCQGGVCHQATPDEIKYIENQKAKNKE